MRKRGRRQRAAAAAVVALVAVACGRDESSGLATLVGTETNAPATIPELVEPVSEPTAAVQPSPETTGMTEPVAAVETDPAGIGADEPASVSSAAEPETATDEQPIESGDIVGQDSADPRIAAGEEPTPLDDMTEEERLLVFAECMREHGVDFPDPVVEADGTVTFGFRPGSGGGGLRAFREIGRDPDLPAARDACRGMLEGLAFGLGQGGFDLIELQDTLLEFAQCMRDNGVDMGDPDLSRFGPGAGGDDQPGGPFGVIDLDDPDFAAAFAVCQQQLPQAGRGPTPGGDG